MSDQYDFFNYLKRISLLLIPIDVPIFLSKIGGYVHVGDGCMHFHPISFFFHSPLDQLKRTHFFWMRHTRISFARKFKSLAHT